MRKEEASKLLARYNKALASQADCQLIAEVFDGPTAQEARAVAESLGFVLSDLAPSLETARALVDEPEGPRVRDDPAPTELFTSWTSVRGYFDEDGRRWVPKVRGAE